ncbi:MAG: hypothetical protein QG641_2981, partial [Candidatus Poribacteria bacterium]|nr:hypothetical protein [Candidatus Poribacteria bacterium]
MRIQQVLIDNWYIKQLDTDKPDIAILTQEALSPDKNWLKAQMPAQIHDILL